MAGAENSLLNLTGKLDRRLFRPIFMCAGEGPFAQSLRALGIPVSFVEFPRLKTPNPFRIWRTAAQLVRFIRAEGVQLVHANTPRSNFYAALAAKWSGARLVWHARNLLTEGMIDLDNILGFVPDRIVCNSDAIRARFRGRQNAVTIINGVNLDRFTPTISGRKVRDEFGIPTEAKVVGITSRLDPEKGHDCFLKAARELAEHHGNLRFMIVGKAFIDGQYREAALRRLSTDLGIADKVIFTGFRTDMPEVLASFDIFILAADAEPCGRVLFEAMSMQKPVVATNTGGTPEIVVHDETGILIPPGDPDALALAIRSLLEDEKRAAEMGRLGRKRAVERFSIEAHVRKTEALYLELLGKSAICLDASTSPSAV
jgi:glycosyltransferase involved in cell wall biosynthesis